MEELLTRAEAASYLGISLTTLDNERLSGRLAYIQRKANGKVWISVEAIKAYLAKGTHTAKPERPAVTTTFRKRRK